MHTAFSILGSQLRGHGRPHLEGRVSAIRGAALTATGLDRLVSLGQRVRVMGQRGPVEGEVVAFDPGGQGGTCILPFGRWEGVSIGDGVVVVADDGALYPDDSWLGQVFDGLGRPIDGAAQVFQGQRARMIRGSPPAPFARRRVGVKLETGIRCLDIFTPICRGQRMGIFAGSGVGKSTLMSMLVRQTQADVFVVGLIGERGRELKDFIEEDLGPDGMARAVVVAATSDEAPMMRRQAAWTATAIAEHFRDQGKQVVLVLDSVTRFAMAQREIGLAAGEPPTSKGYPPTVFAELPQLLERAGPGCGEAGDITALYTVLVDGEDHDEPIADAVRGILDGHVVLERAIAERGRYPAVNIQRSISRMLPQCHAEIELRIMERARAILARHADMADLIRIGAYRPGSDAEIDAAIRFAEPAEAFLSQRKGEATASSTAFAELYGLLAEAGCDIPLPEIPNESPDQVPAVVEREGGAKA